MMKIKIPILCVLAIWLLSCSPQAKLARLIKKHPELVVIDTLKVKLDTTLPEVPFAFHDLEDFLDPPRLISTDSVYWPLDDTIIAEDSNILIRIIKKHTLLPSDITGSKWDKTSLVLSGFIKKREVSQTGEIYEQKVKIVKETNWNSLFKWVGITIGSLLIIVLIFIFAIKKR